MEILSALMLVIIALVLSLSVPRMYADWLAYQTARRHPDRETLQLLLGSQNQWAQRNFWCAVVAIVMVIMIEGTFLHVKAPRLAEVVSVYAALSLTLALMDSFFAQRIAILLVEARRSGSGRRPYER